MIQTNQCKLPDGEWKQISGYEELYWVSPKGEVFSSYSGKILTPIMTHGGYWRVHLAKCGKVKTVAVHRLVAEETT